MALLATAPYTSRRLEMQREPMDPEDRMLLWVLGMLIFGMLAAGVLGSIFGGC